jgi:hypothetical protein
MLSKSNGEQKKKKKKEKEANWGPKASVKG